MKIRVAIFELDEQYLNKIIGAFNKSYIEKIQVYAITDEEFLKEILEK